ncbi:MAG: sugar phosphate isomerase/epimerase [Armatimonadetes bacterium]|nr:sugar phosphate isomerase/epimerase [Armatimonadota bacterium]
MELCLNTSCLCSPFTASAIPLPEKLRLASEAGYRLVELWINELSEYVSGGGDLRNLRRQLEHDGLAVASVITLVGWMDSSGDEYQAILDDCQRRMEMAAEVGSPRIVATPATQRQPQMVNYNLDEVAARYRELLEIGVPLGVTPMMEFLGFVGSVYQLEQAEAVVQLADHPAACLVLDPFHLFRGGSGFSRLKSLPIERIGICHFNDAPREPPQFEQVDADRVYPGDGHAHGTKG